MRTIALLLLVGCGDSGEPLKGDIAIQYGADSPDLKVGTVIEDESDPGKMLVQIGTDEVDCDTRLDSLFGVPVGTFVFFSVDQAPGTYMTFVQAAQRVGNSTSVNISDGEVIIDAVEPRVTGSLTFDTTNEEVGTISVSGTFDVFRCF
jgi:hypothetical protein